MSLIKQPKDYAIRLLLGKNAVPSGLSELNQYFRLYDPIAFHFEKQEDGSLVALSKNFRYGSIITRGATEKELNEKIKDAILTAFEVPSTYAKKVNLKRVGAEQEEYAIA
jgi:hypothetical protein